MADFSLEERFPEMKPINSPPSLSTINGIGMMALGSRDYDPLTHTYVKTHCFCVFFIPVAMLGAYRVADAPEGGWYFLGKVPLSRFARFWNFFVLALIAGGIGLGVWAGHTNSPEYRAQQKLDEAARLAEAKQIGRAAHVYAIVANGTTSHAREAVEKVAGLLDTPAEGVPAEEAAEAVRVAISLSRQWPGPLQGLYERGLHMANRYAAENPRGALLLFDTLARVAPDPTRLAEHEAPVLEKLAAAEPGNLDYANRLAVAYEARKQFDKCEKLLAPHAAKLGDGEGARVLGTIRLRQGKLEEAQRLLSAYTEPRLEKLQQEARDLQAAEQALLNRVLDDLQKGRAADFDYQRYQRSAKEEQRKMIDTYLMSQMKDDAAVRGAREAMARERNVFGAALDLGMVLAQRAQALKGDDRQNALVKAEKTFLALRAAAGPGEEVTVNLGEVYYWLGRQKDAKKLFDGLLRDRNRDPRVLMRVSAALRRVGEGSQARRLAEEAYERGDKAEVKESAAELRATMATEIDDRITWLKRSNLEIPGLRASLNSALGQKAALEGNEEEAVRHLRQAAAEYEQLARNAPMLNNGALVYNQLFRLSGDREDLLRAARMQDEALAQMPGDSILLKNAAGFATDAAVLDVIGPALDLKALRGLSGVTLLPYLYADRKGRDDYARRLRDNPAFARAVQQYERLLILAPRDVLGPAALAMLYNISEDTAALRKLAELTRGLDLDLERSNRETLESYQGKKEEKQRTEHKARVARLRKALEEARKVGGATRAAAAAELALELSRADGLGLPVDADELVRLAEEADRAATSQGTRRELVGSLLARAGRTLVASNKTYAAWVKRSRRALGHGTLLALALTEGGPLAKAVLKNADVQRAMGLERELLKAFPDESNPWAWALLRDTHPKDAARLVKANASDERGRLLRALGSKLGPMNAQGVVNEYWSLRMAGNDTEARAVLRAAAKRGIPLPFDVP